MVKTPKRISMWAACGFQTDILPEIHTAVHIHQQGCRQVKKSGVDSGHARRAHGVRAYNGPWVEPLAGSRGRAMTDPNPPPPEWKLTGFASISGTASGKSGVDMSTPVHPVATPLFINQEQPQTVHVPNVSMGLLFFFGCITSLV